jgi:MFS family permease
MSPSATTVKPRRGVLLRITPFVLVIFFAYLTVGMPLAAIPLQVHDVLGFDNLTVGIVVGMQSLATVLTRQFAGTLCDRRGAKFAMLLGAGGCILAGLV